MPKSDTTISEWPIRSILPNSATALTNIAASITAATRAKTHLAADTVSRHYSDATRQYLARAGALFGLIPWSIAVLVTSFDIVVNSTLLLERFPDTFDPFYFVIKMALWLLAILMLIEGVIELFRPLPAPARPP